MVASTPETRAPTLGNRLLDALPPAGRQRIGRLLTPERAQVKRVLLGPGAPIDAVYFPVDAVVSGMTTLTGGGSIEVATIGNEGFVGSAVALGARAMPPREFAQVLVPGDVLVMDRRSFVDLLATDGRFREIVHRYLRALFSQVAQQVACNARHSVAQRCSRWLLLTHDRVDTDRFPVTHEFLAEMLGVRRASVTLAARALQDAGVIRYRRGEIAVVDRARLEEAACECYRVVRDQFGPLLGPPRRSAS